MKSIFIYYKKIIKDHKKIATFNLFLTFLLAINQVLIPLYFKYYIDNINLHISLTEIIIFIFIFLILLSISNGISVLWHYFSTKFGSIILFELRNEILTKLNEIDYEDLVIIGKEKIKNILFHDTLSIFRNIGNFAIQFLSKLLIIFLILIILFIINIKLFIFIALAFLIGIFVSHYTKKRIKLSSQLVNAELKNTNIFLNSFVDSIKLIKTNPIFNYFMYKHRIISNNFFKTALKNDKVTVFYRNVIANINYFFTIILITYLILISNSSVNIGNIILLFFYIATIFQYSQELEDLYTIIGENLPSFEHVNSILKILVNNENKKNIEPKIDAIRFVDIGFKYKNSNNYILKNINIEFKKGDVIKLIGHNGCGKTTFINLLIGLLSPTNGCIFINNKDIRLFDKEYLKNLILFIGQDETFLNESITDYLNIISNENINLQNLSNLLDEWDFNENGITNLDTFLLDLKGETISVGQRKKILILKLIVRYLKAEVIIIDEIEANLDLKTRTKFDSFKNHILKNSDKIVIEISHEDKSICNYNKIFKIGNLSIEDFTYKILNK